jgi:hypothetical protein
LSKYFPKLENKKRERKREREEKRGRDFGIVTIAEKRC